MTRLDGDLLAEVRHECFKALQCLYISVDREIADDVNHKVKWYIEQLERRILPESEPGDPTVIGYQTFQDKATASAPSEAERE